MNIIKAYAIKNPCYLAAQPMIPQGIVVHSTGANNPNLKRYVDAPDEVGKNTAGNHWNKPGKKVCVHAFIGYDKNMAVRVAELLPLDVCAWGVGKGKKGSYNYDPPHIQFEICEDGKRDVIYYEKAFGVAAEYCAYLCKKFGIPVNRIVSHKEAHGLGYGSNHSDPEHWMKNFGDTMDGFRALVANLLASDWEPPKIENGDLVSIKEGAVYYSGKSIPKWVMSQNWYVKGTPSGERVVIDANEKGSNSICSAINIHHLEIVRKATDSNKNESASPCPYYVKVTDDALVIRKGAGSNTAKVGCIKDQGVYTIVEEKYGTGASLWGKLKSEIGWISLDGVKKL